MVVKVSPRWNEANKRGQGSVSPGTLQTQKSERWEESNKVDLKIKTKK